MSAVPVKPESPASYGKYLDRLRQQIRNRAFELYRQRTGPGSEKKDWLQAEHEALLSPLSCVDDTGLEIRITSAIPGIDPARLTVHALPDRIEVERRPDQNESARRHLSIPLPARIRPAGVTADVRHGELIIVAPKESVCMPKGTQAGKKRGNDKARP